MARSAFLLIVALSALLAPAEVTSSSSRVRDRIYAPLVFTGYCFRRTNGTHQFGCTTHIDGSVGVVQLIRGDPDTQVVLETGPYPPYIALFTPDTFKAETLLAMKDSKRIAGAVLIRSTTGGPEVQSFSDDAKCPNEVSSLYKASEEGVCNALESPWNPSGSGIMLQDFSFPIFYTTDEDTITLLTKRCFEEHNSGANATWPLCAVELKSHMYAAVDTETCVRRSNTLTSLLPTRYCDEMGDDNTFLFMEERNDTKMEDGSVVLITAQLDAMTMFDGTETGGDSPVTSIVTLLETARLLALNPPQFQGKVQNILFALFFGEAFDYIGSSRFTYDMNEGLFPSEPDNETNVNGQQPLLKVDHLHSMVEIGQMFNINSGGRVFAHTDTQFDKDSSVNRLVGIAGQNGLAMRSATSKGLPPSSAQSMLKARRDLPAIFLSDFDSQYSNAYYHSVYDQPTINLDYNSTRGTNQDVVKHIAKTAVTLAEYLYEVASRDNPRDVRLPNFDSDPEIINELLSCYLESADCAMFLAASNSKTPPRIANFPKYPYPQYVGVDWKKQYHGIFTRNVLSLLTGQEVEDVEKEEDCVTPEKQDVYQYIFMRGMDPPEADWEGEVPCNETGSCGHCYRTLAFRRAAVSPAFVIENYDFASSEYSAWAESVWKEVNARIFLKGDPALDAFYFTVGVVVFFLSFVLVLMAQLSAQTLFSVPVLDGAAASVQEQRPSAGGSNATIVTTNTTDSQPTPAAI